MVRRFLEYSQFFTGEPHLDERLAGEYLLRLQNTTVFPKLGKAIDSLEAIKEAGGDVEAAVRDCLKDDADFLDAAVVVVQLWYLGDLRVDDLKQTNPSHYFQGLLWNVIHAHPPGLSGGYFGHWTYPPDN